MSLHVLSARTPPSDTILQQMWFPHQAGQIFGLLPDACIDHGQVAVADQDDDDMLFSTQQVH